MASTVDRNTQAAKRPKPMQAVVASIEEAELIAAQRDPRVQSFLAEADEYLAELERHGRNR